MDFEEVSLVGCQAANVLVLAHVAGCSDLLLAKVMGGWYCYFCGS